MMVPLVNMMKDFFMKNRIVILVYLSEFTARFCTWTLLSQILLYLFAQRGFSMDRSIFVVGACISLAYLSTLVGGVVRDSALTEKQCVVSGLLLIGLGSVLLLSSLSFYAALSLTLLGAGLAVPNLPLLLSKTLGAQNQARHSAVFTLFYGVTNISVILAPIIAGIVADAFSWMGVAVLNAGVIVIWALAITVDSWFRCLREVRLKQWLLLLLSLLGMLALAVVYLVFRGVSESVILFVTAGYVALLLWQCQSAPLDRRLIVRGLLLMLPPLLFFVGEFQVASTVMAYEAQFVHLQWLTLTMPASALMALESVVVVLMTVVLSRFPYFQRWPLARKVALGLLLGASSFAALWLSANHAVLHAVSLGWIVLVMVLLGVGETIIMPSTLASIAHSAPERYKGRLISGIYLALALAGYCSGALSTVLSATLHFSKADLAFYRVTFIATGGLLLFVAMVVGCIAYRQSMKRVTV